MKTAVDPGTLLALALILAVLPAAAVSAQEKHRLDSNPRVIQAQLESSLRLERMAMERLDTPAECLRLTWEAYVQLRAAHANLLYNLDVAKFPNPLLQLAEGKIQTARDHLLWAREYLKNADRIPQGNPTELAADRLRQSARLIELILVMSF